MNDGDVTFRAMVACVVGGKTALTSCSLFTVMGTLGGTSLCGSNLGTYCTCGIQE